jgi:antitoxin component YwqK of YwqJK toxin-antitoxin module
LIPLLLVFTESCQTSTQERHTTYYQNDSLEWEGEMIEEKKTGIWRKYDSLGSLVLLYKYSEDTLKYRERYEDNRIVSSEELLGEDVKHGVTKTYFENGDIKFIGNFEFNEQRGRQKEFFANGNVKLSYDQDSIGMMDFYQYYQNGQLFVKSERPENGLVYFYDSLGNPVADVIYENFMVKDTFKVY